MLAHSSYRRMAAGVVAVIVVSLATVAAAASSAQAQASGVICVGTMSTKLTPGLRLFTRPITTVNNFIYSPCTAPSNPSLTFGTYSAAVTDEFSCFLPMNSSSGIKTIAWNSGEPSTFSFNSTSSTVGGQFVTTLTGVITDGQFAGSPAIEVIVGPAINFADCLSEPGITDRTSVVTLRIDDVA